MLQLFTCNFASPWSLWVHAADASGGARVGYGVTRRWCDPVDATAAGSCAERWRFSVEEIISARRSALVEHEQCKKPVGLESKTYTKLIVSTCIPLWLVTCKRIFRQCLMIALSSKMYHQLYYSQSLPVRPVWRSVEETIGNLAERGSASCLSVY